MAGRAQRIIWFLLPSPCCLPTHFLICLKIIRSTLFVLSSCSHSLLLKLFHLLNFLFFWFCLDFIKSQTQKHLHVKHFLQRTNTHTHTDTHAHTNTPQFFLCSGQEDVARMWQQQETVSGKPKPSRMLPCQPYGMWAHLVTAPRWWTIRSPLPALWGCSPISGLVNGV